MLKLQRNRTEPELIGFFFLHLIHRLQAKGKRRSPIATAKHEHDVQRFVQQNPAFIA